MRRLNRSSPIKKLSGDALWVGGGAIATGLLLVAGTRILTILLSPTEYGRLALAVSLATFSTYLFGYPLGQTATRFYLLSIREKRYPVFFRFMACSTLAALGIVSAIGFCLALLRSFSPGFCDTGMVLLTTLFSCLLVMNRIALGVEDAALERRVRALSQFFLESLRFGLAVSLILLLDSAAAEITLVGFVLAGMVTVFFHGGFLRRLHKKALSNGQGGEKPEASRFRRFILPLILSNGCLWVVLMTERWVLKEFADLSDVGGYTAAYQLAFVPMLFLSNFFIVLAEPFIYSVLGNGTTVQNESKTFLVNSILSALIVLGAVSACTGLYFWHENVGHWLLGAPFRPYSWLFPWLVLAGGCYAASQQLLLKLSYEMRTRDLAALWGIVAVSALAMYLAGTVFFQLKGLLAAVVGIHFLLLVLTLAKIRS